jgi:hypothetical protein
MCTNGYVFVNNVYRCLYIHTYHYIPILPYSTACLLGVTAYITSEAVKVIIDPPAVYTCIYIYMYIHIYIYICMHKYVYIYTYKLSRIGYLFIYLLRFLYNAL